MNEPLPKKRKLTDLELQWKITQANLKIAEANVKIAEANVKIEQEKTTQTANYIILKEKEIILEEKKAEAKIAEHGSSTSTNISQNGCMASHDDFFHRYVVGNIESFNIYSSLINNIIIDDSVTIDFENHCNHLLPLCTVTEKDVQVTFDVIIRYLLKKYEGSTKLQYLNTSKKDYLKFQDGEKLYRYCPDCTFVYKNININADHGKQCLEDFVVCLGELKAKGKSVVDDQHHIGKLLRYLTILLKIQDRAKIYGFLSNLETITFYYVEKKLDPPYFKYYQSQNLQFYNDLGATKSSSNTARSTDEESKNKHFNKDALNLFAKFLTGDNEFYEFTTFDITADDDLLGNRFHIIKKVGTGLTGRVYLLKENVAKNATNAKTRIMKISKHNLHSRLFMNEIKMINKLKEFDNKEKFNYFFEDIIESSPQGKFLLFKNELQLIKSLTKVQSKQLIDIVEYLYNRRIIHRDLRPDNLMVVTKCSHLKLIDFGFATSFNTNETTKELSIGGTIIFADTKFLKHYLDTYSEFQLKPLVYNYPRTFDLQCALNIIMFMAHSRIKIEMNLIQQLQTKTKAEESLKLWTRIKEVNTNYSELLKSINDKKQTLNFSTIKEEIKKLFLKNIQ
ncbi:unnamed protein product [Rotaria sp. Silwood1]|nr:unnamed protein product [Rotaria sp. Silwood1]